MELMEEAVNDLPMDLKDALRIVEDPEVDDESRISLAGAILHVVSSDAAIPGVRGTLQHVGSVLVMRLALERAREKSPEALARHAEESPRLLGDLDEELEVARAFLGDGMKILEEVVEKLPEQDFRGHGAKECVHDEEHSTWLYDTVHVSLVEQLEIDEDDVAREIKGAERIRKSLAARARK
ncbi:MAG: hypothetical protein CMN31_07745 [Sandaracinus sp.]|nr:hypothetical protein [Myxococcales bacterium]MAT27946.1 hypothetical protein [Sandaracinus sp.]MBJ71220.1 hypothetical protein [Sandaracinus sp.]